MQSVTAAVVVFNGAENIRACLDSLVRQNYPRELIEILIVDNDSTDETQQIVKGYCSRFAHVRMVINPIRGIACSRNLALEQARFEWIAFTDSDCVVPIDWLSRLVEGFERHAQEQHNLAGVGSANEPPQNESRFYRALGVFLQTFLGNHGSAQGKQWSSDRVVSHLPTVNVLYRKECIEQVGGFDVTFGNIGEDQDLSYRLGDRGFVLIYCAGNAVTHKLRPTRTAWFKNMALYGKGRMWLMFKHPQKIKCVLLLPMLLVAVILLPVVFGLGYFGWLPVLYFGSVLIYSIMICFKYKCLDLLFDLYFLYIGTHIAYGVGEWTGILKRRKTKQPQK